MPQLKLATLLLTAPIASMTLERVLSVLAFLLSFGCCRRANKVQANTDDDDNALGQSCPRRPHYDDQGHCLSPTTGNRRKRTPFSQEIEQCCD